MVVQLAVQVMQCGATRMQARSLLLQLKPALKTQSLSLACLNLAKRRSFKVPSHMTRLVRRPLPSLSHKAALLACPYDSAVVAQSSNATPAMV